MTKSEAYRLIKMTLRNVREKQLYEAIQIALRALAWECAHEKLMTYEQEIVDENQPI